MIEKLLCDLEEGFLIKLRVHFEFDEVQYQKVKDELTALVDKYKGQDMVPRYLLPLLSNMFLYLSAQAGNSIHAERIEHAIDELSAIIDRLND